MPVYYPSSRKSTGFSIDDLIENKPSASLYHLPPSSGWYHLPPTNFYQSTLQYLRHVQQLTNPSTAFLLHAYRKPKRNRTAFTPSQLLRLENEFEKNHYIVGQERKDLAKHLNLPEAKVKVWYQNRRTKHKRLIHEDSHSSSNEIDHPNDSNTTIHIDDETASDLP